MGEGRVQWTGAQKYLFISPSVFVNPVYVIEIVQKSPLQLHKIK